MTAIKPVTVTLPEGQEVTIRDVCDFAENWPQLKKLILDKCGQDPSMDALIRYLMMIADKHCVVD